MSKNQPQRKQNEGGGVLIPILVAAMVCVVLTTTFIVGYGLQYTAEQREIEAQQSESAAPVRNIPPPSESPVQTVSAPPEPTDSEPQQTDDAEPEESVQAEDPLPVTPSPSTTKPASPSQSAEPPVSPSPSEAPSASQPPRPSEKQPESQAPASQPAQSSKPQATVGNGGGSWGEDRTTNEITGDLNRTAYWTKSGKSYHFSKDCPSLSKSKSISSGTLQEALNVGKTDPCNNCAGGS